MIDLSLFLEHPELAKNIRIEASGDALLAFGESIHQKAMDAIRKESTKSTDELLTPKQFAEALQISLVTLWSWDKKEITHPVRIGNQKRYRRSDLEKIMNHE